MTGKSIIKKIKAREILDSRGIPTVQAELIGSSGRFLASVPSGTSKGKDEAVELRDRGKRRQGLGVLAAVKNINQIIGPKLQGRQITSQKEIDSFLIELDGTENKSKLGANAILAVSILAARAGAAGRTQPLWKWISGISGRKPLMPAPCILFAEGGMHGKGGLEVQEFMGFFPGKSFSQKLKLGIETYFNLSSILKKKYGKKGIVMGMEGAFSPPIKNPKEFLDLLLEASAGKDLKIILDMAVSHSSSPKKPEYYLNLAEDYPIFGFEDPFSESDWLSWKKLKAKAKSEKKKFLIIGDDLTVTNQKRIKKAYKEKACNAIVVKPNQIGTVSEAIEAVDLAKKINWKVMVSHRSGETMDDFIADLAVGAAADMIKSGAPSKPERMVKYSRLLKIEKELCQN